MTSPLEGDNNQIPLRVAFDDGVEKKGNEDGIEVLHKRKPDVEDKKKRKEEKERKRKKDNNKEKKTEMEIRPVAALAVIVEPEKVIDDKPNEAADEPANDEKTDMKADDGNNVPDVPDDNSNAIQPSEEPKKSTLKKKHEEPRQDESSKKLMIRPATRRDFYDDRIEPDSRRSRADRGSNSSVVSYKRQDRPIRDPRRRKETRDACTTTRDALFRPCKFFGGKESCRDLCERRKAGKCDKGTLSGLDKWCDERSCEKGRRGTSREGRTKNTVVFNNPGGSVSEGVEGKGDDWEGNRRRRTRDVSTDEITQLKNDLTNLQIELDRLKEYLKNIGPDKNKCTITRMKEHFRCNFPYSFPDFTRIREKLKNCYLMKIKLCREFKITTNRDRWRKDFECLMNELNNIRFELEKMRKDKS